MQLNKGRLLAMYMVINGFTAIVPVILIQSFGILLFDIDQTGYSAAYLEPSNLLGIGIAGLVGGGVFRLFSCYTLGFCLPFGVVLVLCYLLWYGEVNLKIFKAVLSILSIIMSIEHANAIFFLNHQITKQNKPLFFSSFQLFLQCFNVIAPVIAKKLIMNFGFQCTVSFCIAIYLFRMIPWWGFWMLRLPAIKAMGDGMGLLCGFQEVISNTGLMRVLAFRMMNHVVTVLYIVGLPIVIAKLVQGNSHDNASLYSYSLSLNNLGFIIGGILGSLILKRKFELIVYFLQMSPIVIGCAVCSMFYANVIGVKVTALFYGLGLYLLKTSNTVIAQALTPKHKLAHAILAGDALVKFGAYKIGLYVPRLLEAPPILDKFPPFWVAILIGFLSLIMVCSIVRIYRLAIKHSHKMGLSLIFFGMEFGNAIWSYL